MTIWNRLFGPRSTTLPLNPCDLRQTLLDFGGGDVLTLGDAMEGVLALGRTGSGKTTGVGETLAGAMLSQGMGGLVLCVKPGEVDLWRIYAERYGRAADLVVFDDSCQYRFNFLDHELNRPGGGAGHTENIVNLFMSVTEVAERGRGGGGRDDEGYWRRATKQLLRNAVNLSVLAIGQVSVPVLYRLLISAPQSREEAIDPGWMAKSFCFQCLDQADRQAKSEREANDYKLIEAYFIQEFATLSDKTRSVIVSSLTSMFDVMQRGIYRDLFSTTTTITPEATLDGKIIVVALDVKEFGDIGLFANVLWKLNFQRCVERRDTSRNSHAAFLWMDEAHHFLTSGDQLFQSTCRSSRVVTVMLTQNISNVYAALGGGQNSQAEADSLLACLTTKFFGSNADPVTNEWASKLIGREKQYLSNQNSSLGAEDWSKAMWGQTGGDPQQSAGMSEAWEHTIQPHAFAGLRSGGPAHRFLVDTVVHRSGRTFNDTNQNWRVATFRQHLGGKS